MKINNNLFIISLRQSFLQIVPFYILSSLGLLFKLLSEKDIIDNNLIQGLIFL